MCTRRDEERQTARKFFVFKLGQMASDLPENVIAVLFIRRI
jgi:hypothetical protein